MPAKSEPSLDYLFVKVPVGTRLNRTIVKVLKATAEYLDMPFSGLLESVAVAAMQGECYFSPDVLKQIEKFKEIYGLNAMYDAMADADADDDDANAAELRPEDLERQIQAAMDALKSQRAK